MVRLCLSWWGWDISGRNPNLPHVYKTNCPIEGSGYVHRVDMSLALLGVLVLRRDRRVAVERRSRDQRLLQVRAISRRSNAHAAVCIADLGAVDSPFRAAAEVGLPSAVVYRQKHLDRRRHQCSSHVEYVSEYGLMDVGIVEDSAHRSSDRATSRALLSLTCRSMTAHNSLRCRDVTMNSGVLRTCPKKRLVYRPGASSATSEIKTTIEEFPCFPSVRDSRWRHPLRGSYADYRVLPCWLGVGRRWTESSCGENTGSTVGLYCPAVAS